MAEHTPGPWKFDNVQLWAGEHPNDRSIMRVDSDYAIVFENAADRDLIEAAPRLKAALRSIARNTCCDRCQEAALVAQAALAGDDPPGWTREYFLKNGDEYLMVDPQGRKYTPEEARAIAGKDTSGEKAGITQAPSAART